MYVDHSEFNMIIFCQTGMKINSVTDPLGTQLLDAPATSPLPADLCIDDVSEDDSNSVSEM